MGQAGKRAIFFDIDGTLYDRDNPEWVPESTRFVLARLRELGHLTFICTGRVRCAVEERLLALPFDGLILGCGTHIIFRGEEWYCRLLEPETVKSLAGMVRKYEGFAVLEGKNGLFCETLSASSKYWEYFKKRSRTLAGVLHPMEQCDWEINKLTVQLPCHNRYLTDKLLAEAGRLVDHIDAGKYSEFVPKGHSKATGIAYILERLGIPKEDTFAFGDSMNDWEMLSFVGCGIAMGNSSPEILRLCLEHTDRLYEDGIYKACMRHGLL